MRECASLTKMMTVHLALMLCERLGLEVGLTWLQVSKKSARMIGTSA
jgi:D-alanyl-D-alanine carboxypeptidase